MQAGVVGGGSHFCRVRMCGGGSEGEQMGQHPGAWALGVGMHQERCPWLWGEGGEGPGGLRRTACV